MSVVDGAGIVSAVDEPPPDLSTPGKRLKHAMKARGLKQEALETLSGVDQSVISKLCNDLMAKPPTYDVAMGIARALAIRSEWWLEASGPMDAVQGYDAGIDLDPQRPNLSAAIAGFRRARVNDPHQPLVEEAVARLLSQAKGMIDYQVVVWEDQLRAAYSLALARDRGKEVNSRESPRPAEDEAADSGRHPTPTHESSLFRLTYIPFGICCLE